LETQDLREEKVSENEKKGDVPRCPIDLVKGLPRFEDVPYRWPRGSSPAEKLPHTIQLGRIGA
jgi:hypothetical protein